MPGPIALVGSGEWLPVMQEVEAGLLAGRAPKYVQLSTAAGQESRDSLDRWRELGAAQGQRLGVEVDWLPVLDRESANDADLAARVAGAGLIYLSGGDPSYLAETLHGSLVFDAIAAEWLNGAALGGCSAGAMALSSSVPRIRDVMRGKNSGTVGLGITPHIRVWPHFDRMGGWIPEPIARHLLKSDSQVTVIGVDEDTAIVGGPTEWVVQGRQRAWVFDSDGHRTPFSAGDTITLPTY
jgi:cyanophycinase